MGLPFIDTDVIIRLLTGDDLRKQAAAAALFEQIEQRTLTAAAPDTVIADAVYVLASRELYKKKRVEIRDLLAPIVRLPHFHIQNRSSVLDALDLYASTNLDFGDTLIIATMMQQSSQTLFSYDRDFDRIKTIIRQEP